MLRVRRVSSVISRHSSSSASPARSPGRCARTWPRPASCCSGWRARTPRGAEASDPPCSPRCSASSWPTTRRHRRSEPFALPTIEEFLSALVLLFVTGLLGATFDSLRRSRAEAVADGGPPRGRGRAAQGAGGGARAAARGEPGHGRGARAGQRAARRAVGIQRASTHAARAGGGALPGARRGEHGRGLDRGPARARSPTCPPGAS